MKRIIAFLAAIAFCAVNSVVADYSVNDKGTWPTSWPKQLEPLRKHARTLVGPMAPYRHYQIPFTKRQEFEAAWPHLMKVKSKGAPIILVRGPKTDFFEVKPAGVLIHSPPAQTDKRANPETPIPGQSNPRTTWMNTTFIELVVDGDIVDLNRIPLPADTPIIDERFEDGQKKSLKRSSEDLKINTPVISESLQGSWELQPEEAGKYKQTLYLGPQFFGAWQQSRETLPVSIAWFVEGGELRILHYYEPDGAFNYRVKTLMVAYKLLNDRLTLTLDGKSTTWKRTK